MIPPHLSRSLSLRFFLPLLLLSLLSLRLLLLLRLASLGGGLVLRLWSNHKVIWVLLGSSVASAYGRLYVCQVRDVSVPRSSAPSPLPFAPY